MAIFTQIILVFYANNWPYVTWVFQDKSPKIVIITFTPGKFSDTAKLGCFCPLKHYFLCTDTQTAWVLSQVSSVSRKFLPGKERQFLPRRSFHLVTNVSTWVRNFLLRSQSYDRELQRQRCKFLQRHG
jgi:hypothetical protein